MKTERLHLKLIESSDINEVLDMFNEEEAFKYIRPLQNKNTAFYLDFLNLKIEEIKLKKGFYWMVRNYHSKLVGAINLTPIPYTDNIQIGWQIRKQFRKQGFAFEASKAVLKFTLTQTDFDPIFSVFEKENIASKKILNKLNFEFYESVDYNGIELKKYIFKKHDK